MQYINYTSGVSDATRQQLDYMLSNISDDITEALIGNKRISEATAKTLINHFDPIADYDFIYQNSRFASWKGTYIVKEKIYDSTGHEIGTKKHRVNVKRPPSRVRNEQEQALNIIKRRFRYLGGSSLNRALDELTDINDYMARKFYNKFNAVKYEMGV